ncbi:MAG: hypothetical protein AB9842_05790 [Bacteroidales bacterium]
MRIRRFLFLVVLICPGISLQAQKYWSFELMGGVVYNLPLPLVIEQQGYPDIRIEKALFSTEPFISPYYWDWRFTRATGIHRFEFEAIHHKLYLLNKPAEVERFGISHGFNMLLFSYGQERSGFIIKAGAGPVLIHPESTIRGKVYPEGPGFDIKGYRLKGLALQLGLARQFSLNRTFFINTEAKIIAAFANAPVVDGRAKVRNLSFQLVVGPGVKWAKRD